MAATDPPIDPLGALMRAAQDGDAPAYAELLKTITPRIRRVVQRERGFVGRADVDGPRRYARTAAREINWDHEDDVTFGAAETNEETAEIGDERALREAVQALPEGQREAIELLKLEELSLKEAAAVSGTSVGALKVATHRALHALRHTLATK